MRKKATKSYRTARLLRATDCNSAASRAYYALFQAIVSYLEEEGYLPEDCDQHARLDDDEETRWRHSWLRKHSEKLLPLTREQFKWLNRAWMLRCRADYEAEDIEAKELDDILAQVPSIFAQLGKVPT